MDNDEAQQIAMTEGARKVLQEMLRNDLPEAVAEGIKKVVTAETARVFADVFIDAMKQQASVKVDTWAGKLVKGAAAKIWNNLWLIVFAIVFAYSVGGFGAVAALGKWAIQQALTPT